MSTESFTSLKDARTTLKSERTERSDMVERDKR